MSFSRSVMLVVALGVVGLLVACGGGGKRQWPDKVSQPTPPSSTTSPATSPPPGPKPKPKPKPVDYRSLPNCLEMFAAVAAVEWEGKTEAAYLAECHRLARKPCRIELRLADVSGTYDLADVELLADDGESGLPVLQAAGDLGGYHKHLKTPFTLAHVKKKGLLTIERKVGDRVTLTGTGDVVDASPWGAANPRKGMPTGDERYVMLRAFGRPNKYHPWDHQFAFMVKDWVIAAQ